MVSPERDALGSFNLEGGHDHPVCFVETIAVANGVECDVYTFVGDRSKDLGVIRMKPGSKTPLQRVLKGDRTVEGYVSGKGTLTITKTSGEKEIHYLDSEPKEPFSMTVGLGELIQWEADPNSELVAYEVCYPPYEDGRYENLT